MKRILVIERDAKIRDLLTRFLGVKGYDVTATIDAASGMDRFIGERPDLILVDMQLPDKSGLDLCRAIRETRLDVALVLMGTARQARRPEVESARETLGIPLFLTKPFGVAALIEAIERGLEGPTGSVAQSAPPPPHSAPSPSAPPPSAPPPSAPPPSAPPAPTAAPRAAPTSSAPMALLEIPSARPSGAFPRVREEPPTLEEVHAVASPAPSTAPAALQAVTASVTAPASPSPEPRPAHGDPNDPAASIGANSAGGLLGGRPPSVDSVQPPGGDLPTDMTASRLEAVYAVDETESHTWGLESLRMEAIRHGPSTVDDDEQRYALQPIVPQSPSDPRGIYDAITVPNLLYRCFRDLFTGRLVIRRGPVRKTITLANGRPIGAESNIRSESLGYLLLQEGLINQRHLEQSGRIARQRELKQGDALVRLGAIDSDQLSEALRQQLRLRILSCFAWSGAEYGLTYEPDIQSRVDAIELNPLVLIFDGIKTSFPIAPLVSHFDQCNRSPVRSTSRLRDYATMLREFADELRLATLCDGQNTLGDVVARSPYGLVDTLRILRALEITGCLVFEAQRAAEVLDRPTSPRQTVGGSLDGSISLNASFSGRSASTRRPRASMDGGQPRRRTIDVPVVGSTGGSVGGSENIEPSQSSLASQAAQERRRAARNRREAARQTETGPDLIKADANFAKGRRCLDNEDLQNALAHFQLACKQDPHQHLFKMYRGWVRFLLAAPNDRKARAQAHDEIKAAIDADSNQDEGYVLLGNVYRALGKEDKAMKLYRKALSLNRRNPAANRAIREMEGRRTLEERDPQGLFGKFFTRR